MKKKLFLIIPGLLIELIYILYRVIPASPAQTVIKYMVVYAAAFIMMVVSFALVKNQDFSRSFFLIVLLFSLIFGLTLMSAPPDQSDDIYRYLWDGKLQYYSISPYSYAPDDPTLKQYHSEQLPKLVNFPHIKTIYPPVAQLFFLCSYSLWGESVTGMKFLFLLIALGSIFFFYLLLKQKGTEIRWLLFFAWNPLVIMETAVNGHLDILMVFFLLMSLWCFHKKGVAPPPYNCIGRGSEQNNEKKTRFFCLLLQYISKNMLVFSGISLACAVLGKLIPVILLPLFFFYFLFSSVPPVTSVAKKILKFFIPLVSTITVFYLLYWQSAQNMFLTAINYSTKWYFNNPLFHGILAIFKDNTTAHMVSFSLFIMLYLLILMSSFELDKKIFLAVAAFVICNPTIHPWYLLILLALLCIHRSVIVVMWSGLVIVSYMVVYDFKLTGNWQDSWFLMAIEYIPLVILLAIQWRGKVKGRRVEGWKEGGGTPG